MAKLIYTAIASLDGYIEDGEGSFEWAMPDAEVHGFANELEKTIGTHLYGRRMYETMAVWQEITEGPEVAPEEVAYGEVWRSLDKVVYSTTLDAVTTPRTQLERTFDPEAVAQLKASAEGDISVSGPTLAQHAFRAGLVDEVQMFLFPLVIGGGKPGLPLGTRVDLELLESRRFGNGVVYAHYRTT